MRPDITIILPVYNEEVHIDGTLAIIREQLAQLGESFEMLIVDDGSTDRTWLRIEETCRRFAELSAIRLSRNFGKELALCAGLEHARGRAVIVMDADLQHPPSLLEEMVLLWKEEGYEIVECVKRSRGKEPLRNKLGSASFYYILNRLSGFDLRGASDFKLLDGKVVEAWRNMPERKTFFRGMTAWLGFSRTQIEFEVPERAGSTTRWSFLGDQTGGSSRDLLLVAAAALRNACRSPIFDRGGYFGRADAVPQNRRRGGNRLHDRYSAAANYRQHRYGEPRHYRRVYRVHLQ